MKSWTDNSPLDLGEDELKRFDEAIPALLKPLKTLKEKYENLIVYSQYEERFDDLSILTGFYEKSDNGVIKPNNLRTTNLMGVINYRKGDKEVKISIGSRFDKDKGQPFLTYMLMRAFEGIMVDWKPKTTEDDNWNLLLIFLFKHHLCKAYRQGLLKQYVNQKNNDYNFKGALDVPGFVRNNTPFLGKISYTTREYTTDNPVLWLIRRAADYIGNEYPDFYHSFLKTNQETSEALQIIVEATPSYERQTPYHLFHPCQKPIRHPFYFEYENLRKVCLQLLRREGLSLYGNDKNKEEIYGVLFDGAWLWECFVASLLKSVKGNFKHYKYREDKGIQVFKDDKNYCFLPDFYDGKMVVLDAKYKHWKKDKDRADIHQVLSYMYLTGATKGGVIFPDENGNIEEKRINTEYSGMWFDIPLIIPQGLGKKEFHEAMNKNIKDWGNDLKKRLYIV